METQSIFLKISQRSKQIRMLNWREIVAHTSSERGGCGRRTRPSAGTVGWRNAKPSWATWFSLAPRNQVFHGELEVTHLKYPWSHDIRVIQNKLCHFPVANGWISVESWSQTKTCPRIKAFLFFLEQNLGYTYVKLDGVAAEDGQHHHQLDELGDAVMDST